MTLIGMVKRVFVGICVRFNGVGSVDEVQGGRAVRHGFVDFRIVDLYRKTHDHQLLVLLQVLTTC